MTPCSDVGLGDLCGLVQRRFGILMPEDRRRTLLLDLQGSAWAGEGLVGLYHRVLANDSLAIDWLLEHITVNHTGFFREVEAYDVFLEAVLPRLGTRPVRVWSAASSTGEELYTLVFVLAEHLGLRELQERWRFLGTDISATAVARAEAGVYDVASTHAVPAATLAGCFQFRVDGLQQVRPELRALCTFRRLNLIDRPLPFQRPFDVVFCRNVLYYFAASEQSEVLTTLHGVTVDGGFLLTGVCDSVRQVPSPWFAHSPILFERRR